MKHFSSGTIVLLVSGFICKVLGALFRFPLTNMLGIDGIGVFQLIMSLYSFSLVFVSGGVTTALSQLISSARASGQTNKIKLYLRHAILISTGCSLLLGLFFLLAGKSISAFQNLQNAHAYFLFLLLLPLGSLLACLRGFFQGYERMTPTAISQVLEQVVKFGCGIFFAYLFSSISITAGVFGAFVGVAASEVVALIFLLIYYAIKRDKRREIFSKEFSRRTLKEFSLANFPLMLSGVVLPLVSAFESLIIIPRLVQSGFDTTSATVLFGLQSGVVGSILNFPLVISIAVTTALLPNLSYQISRGAASKHIIEKGLKMLFYMVLPTTFGLVAISKPLLSLVYQNITPEQIKYAFYLMLSGGFLTIFTALMQFVVMVLEANGEFRYVLFIVALGGVARVVVSYSLSAVKSINVFALVLGGVAMTSIVCLFGLERLRRKINFKLPLVQMLVLFLGTALMYFGVYTFEESNYFSTLANTFVGVIIGVVVYGVVTISVLMNLFNLKKKTITNNVV